MCTALCGKMPKFYYENRAKLEGLYPKLAETKKAAKCLQGINTRIKLAVQVPLTMMIPVLGKHVVRGAYNLLTGRVTKAGQDFAALLLEPLCLLGGILVGMVSLQKGKAYAAAAKAKFASCGKEVGEKLQLDKKQLSLIDKLACQVFPFVTSPLLFVKGAINGVAGALQGDRKMIKMSKDDLKASIRHLITPLAIAALSLASWTGCVDKLKAQEKVMLFRRLFLIEMEFDCPKTSHRISGDDAPDKEKVASYGLQPLEASQKRAGVDAWMFGNMGLLRA